MGDEDNVPSPEFDIGLHNELIWHELTCLAQGNAFLKEFYKLCKEKGVSVFKSETFLFSFGKFIY